MTTKNPKRRSQAWFGKQDRDGFVHRSWTKKPGYPHDSLDGRGYPYGLRGKEIPLIACIIAVADTFDAMTTHRPYQSAMEPGVAIDYILSFASKKFDPDVAQALQTAFKEGKIKMMRAATVA